MKIKISWMLIEYILRKNKNKRTLKNKWFKSFKVTNKNKIMKVKDKYCI
jgi:hypothetical protein